jgi:hypothetical protein
VQHCQDTADRVRQLELYRLDRIRLSLDPKKADPRVADTLIRMSERVAKLHGLDAPQRIEASGPNGGPIETEERPDYSKLTLDELLLLEAMAKKSRGIANWDERLVRAVRIRQDVRWQGASILRAPPASEVSGHRRSRWVHLFKLRLLPRESQTDQPISLCRRPKVYTIRGSS